MPVLFAAEALSRRHAEARPVENDDNEIGGDIVACV